MCETKKQGFVHLHAHSHYSVQDALATPKEYAHKAREMGFEAAALTDHGRMGGTIEFVEACRDNHKGLPPIKPIVGCEVYTCADRHNKSSVVKADGSKGRPKHNHLTLLAQNATGYRNLLNSVSIGAEEGYYYEPRVDHEVLEKHNEGIIALSGCLASETSQALMRGDDEAAEETMRWFKDIYGDRYYVELQYHGIPEQKLILPKLAALASKLDIKTVATNDVHYMNANDWRVHDILIQMRDISEDRRAKNGKLAAYSTHQFFLKSEEDMLKIFKAKPESVSNTMELSERVEDYMKLDVPHLLPSVAIPTNDERFIRFKQKNLPYHKPNDAYLAYLAMDGLRQLGFDVNEEYRNQLKRELEQIWFMGVTDYFLIQAEMVKFMKGENILYGIRGSGVGSLVNYCLQVSTVDPIRWKLMFERFLNPGRGNQYRIDYSCCPVKEWLDENGKQDQTAAVLRLRELSAESLKKNPEYAQYEPQIAKEIWVLEMANLATYICDIADRGMTTKTNESQLWSAFFLGITDERPEADMIVKKVAPLPDVDTDIDDSRRQEVIEWTRRRFGHEHVAMIGTWGTYQAKAAVVGSLKVSEKFEADWADKTHQMAHAVSKTIPIRPQAAGKSKDPIGDAMLESPEFKQWANRYPEEIVLAKGLMDRISHLGIHAGGVLVASEPIHDHVPVENSKGVLASAYDMNSVERVGLVKYDYLGLATYQMVALALRHIERRHNKKIDLMAINLDDPKVFALYAAGKTSTVFQFASRGMQDALRLVQASDVEDLIAIAALYRPGPMEFIPDYATGKKNPSKIKYAHPVIKKHLEVTYGIMVYQEQAMFLARELAGLDHEEVDKLRKAVSKKDPEAFEKICDVFKKKAAAKGVSEEVIQQTQNLMGKFAGYAFNRSHACAYAILSYWTAYLRTYFPSEWMAAVMHVDRDNDDKMAIYRRECKAERIEVRQPNVNDSGLETTVTGDGCIALPLNSIKGVGDSMAQVVVEHQPFESLKDMVWRARPNRGMIEHLANGGALHCFEDVRTKHSVEDVMTYLDELVYERNQEDKRRKKEEKMKYKVLSPLDTEVDVISGVSTSQPTERRVKPRKETSRIKPLNTKSLFPKDIL